MSRSVKSADYAVNPIGIAGGHYGGSLKETKKLRRIASALEPTIASRGKLRPEPKFQKVVTSQILSQMRKDSKLISRNPVRFLEGLVEGQTHPCQLSTESFSNLLTGFGNDKAENGYQATLKNLENKCRLTKNRNLLLNLGSNPAIRKLTAKGSETGSTSSATFSSFFAGQDNYSEEIDVTKVLQSSKESSDEVEVLLQSFLDEIRVANVNNIVAWVEHRATLNDLELPFGLPTSGLRIPIQDLENQVRNMKCKEFVSSAVDEFFLLDAEYHAKLEEIYSRVTDNIRELERADWASKDSALLSHIMNLMNSDVCMKGSHFSKEKLATELATRILPLYSREEIIAQKFRIKVKRALEEKLNSTVKDWVRDKENLVKKINTAWVDIVKKVQLKKDFAHEKKLQIEKCQYWMSLLEDTRMENRKKIRYIESLLQPLESEQREKTRIKEREERQRRLQQKNLVDKFRKMKLETLGHLSKQQEEQAEMEEKKKKIQMTHNRARVYVRQREFEIKQERTKQLERMMEEEKLVRMEMLEKTKEKVEIDYDPSNILLDTHASNIRNYEIEMDLVRGKDVDKETVNFFRERYSFTAETLWKDTRVRLEAKLREAGLIGNSYARHVLLAMQPKPKPHLHSQIKFEQDD